MKTKPKKNNLVFWYLFLIVLVGALSLYLANADPQGATVNYQSTDSGPTKTPGMRQDDGGRIITVNLFNEQQDDAWKAYVGNVTGSFVLQNSNNKSIYEWPSGASITGEVYISRNSSLNFSAGAISCANNSVLVNEQSFLGLGSTDTDNINNTFNSTNHTGFNVGTNVIAQNSCRAIALWVNDTVQTPSPSAIFQEVALFDMHTLVYASLINNAKFGFDNTTRYDFQAIIAENRSGTGTPYYFYVELGS